MGESGTAMMYDPRTMTLENLGDPQITARDLADIAAQRPDLWDAIAVHPQCYPALVSWIRERGFVEFRAGFGELVAVPIAKKIF
ncbi:hypothetical protein R6G99_10415, partial [Actinotignum timonense]|nr:hypothetical protein [Actinotignum timonense]